MNLLLKPIQVLVLYFLAMLLWSSVSWGGFAPMFWLGQLWHFFLVFVPGFLVYWFLQKQKLAAPTRWEYRFITSSILFLLFDPLLPWWSFLVMGLVAELGQRFIRVPTGPVMNPAALAAVVITFFGFYPGWWGVSFAPRLPVEWGGLSLATLLLTIPIVGYVANSYKKLPIAIIGMAVFAVSYALVFMSNPLFILIEGTLIFFFLVMADEPKTSPVLRKEQFIFGGTLGLLMTGALFFAVAEPYCMPLLICNVVFNVYRNRRWIMAKFNKPQPPQSVTPLPQQ
jgi:Na+-translocating ferredoxin:NAD+ oxidoreductase RnfD subunit